ncbi:MAG TPA: hypothetical protein VK841_17045 [Polyangiaceae bacterium]|jgi:hypothetical protein|nr:hypothetical protein [Polyangiaceae bacterium]
MGGVRGWRSNAASARAADGARRACQVLFVAGAAWVAVGCKSGAQDSAGSSAMLPDGAAPKPVVTLAPHWNPGHQELPRTCDVAVTRLLGVLDPDLRAQLLATPHEGLGALHDSLGTSVANAFGLWDDNPELLLSCASARPGTPPDPNAVSQLIIERAWDRLQKTVPPRDSPPRDAPPRDE